MISWLDKLPFRLGTTSYIIPDDILPNLRWLAGKVRDVELVLFDVDEYCNIPDARQITEMNAIAADHDMTFTVHLPLDLNFSTEGANPSIEKALKVIHGVEALNPVRGYVCHLDSHALREGGPSKAQWQAERGEALAALLRLAPLGKRLCVENLENYPIEWNRAVIDGAGVSACVDIGHLWLQNREVPSVLTDWLPDTEVIHLHGIGTRDHQSLRHMPIEKVGTVLRHLIQSDYHGVLTLEVFNESDWAESMNMIEEILWGPI